MLDHGPGEPDRGAKIVVVVLERNRHTLPDRFVASEVDDFVDVAGLENVVEERSIPKVTLVKGHVGGREGTNRIDGRGRTVVEIVDQHDLTARLVERDRSM